MASLSQAATLYPSTLLGAVRNLRVIAYSFAPQGTSAPIRVTGNLIKSFTRTGVGTFVVAFQRPFRFLVDAQVTLGLGTFAAQSVQYSGINVKASGTGKQSATIQVFTTSSGAASDIAAGANNIIYGEIYVQNA
jgi:hypothetical protein